MSPVRVLVVDDSVVIRRLVTDVLAEDAEIEVIGTASDGRLALTKIASLRPDVVTLDIEMPNMTGLECLAELRKSHPRLPVIMFSTLTERGAAATLDALAIGASDYVTKPANVGSVQAGMQAVRDQLVPKVKALGQGTAGRHVPKAAPQLRAAPPLIATAAPGTARIGSPRPVVASAVEQPSPPTVPSTGRPIRRPGGIDVLVIGTSTGGPSALAEIWTALPSRFPVPILIVQHMPPTFTTLLAERLTRLGTVPVAEAEDGVVLEPGKAWLAPGDFHMVVERCAQGGKLRLNQDAPENSCRPAVDPTFRTAAATFGAGVLGVVLTGMGADGCDGSRAIVAAGGQVIAQDEATSVVWGMPGAVSNAGLAQKLVALGDVAPAICDLLDRPRSVSAGLRSTSVVGVSR